MKPTKKELLAIEIQLKCPKGKQGIEIGKTMHNSNIDMTIDSINALELKDNETVLEIGHGNCEHLFELLKLANISYYGLEISEIMQQEAKKINKKYLQKNQIKFDLYNGKDMPYKDYKFHKIFTINTIYFWDDSINYLKKIYRVLKKNGIFVVTFAQKQFMKSLPFVLNKFNLFDKYDLKNLINTTNFKLIKIIEKSKIVKSKTGELVKRKFIIAILK